jgi:hypothetical protein
MPVDCRRRSRLSGADEVVRVDGWVGREVPMADKQDRHFTERPSGTVHVESCETERDDNA